MIFSKAAEQYRQIRGRTDPGHEKSLVAGIEAWNYCGILQDVNKDISEGELKPIWARRLGMEFLAEIVLKRLDSSVLSRRIEEDPGAFVGLIDGLSRQLDTWHLVNLGLLRILVKFLTLGPEIAGKSFVKARPEMLVLAGRDRKAEEIIDMADWQTGEESPNETAIPFVLKESIDLCSLVMINTFLHIHTSKLPVAARDDVYDLIEFVIDHHLEEMESTLGPRFVSEVLFQIMGETDTHLLTRAFSFLPKLLKRAQSEAVGLLSCDEPWKHHKLIGEFLSAYLPFSAVFSSWDVQVVEPLIQGYLESWLSWSEQLAPLFYDCALDCLASVTDRKDDHPLSASVELQIVIKLIVGMASKDAKHLDCLFGPAVELTKICLWDLDKSIPKDFYETFGYFVFAVTKRALKSTSGKVNDEMLENLKLVAQERAVMIAGEDPAINLARILVTLRKIFMRTVSHWSDPLTGPFLAVECILSHISRSSCLGATIVWIVFIESLIDIMKNVESKDKVVRLIDMICLSLWTGMARGVQRFGKVVGVIQKMLSGYQRESFVSYRFDLVTGKIPYGDFGALGGEIAGVRKRLGGDLQGLIIGANFWGREEVVEVEEFVVPRCEGDFDSPWHLVCQYLSEPGVVSRGEDRVLIASFRDVYVRVLSILTGKFPDCLAQCLELVEARERLVSHRRSLLEGTVFEWERQFFEKGVHLSGDYLMDILKRGKWRIENDGVLALLKRILCRREVDLVTELIAETELFDACPDDLVPDILARFGDSFLERRVQQDSIGFYYEVKNGVDMELFLARECELRDYERAACVIAAMWQNLGSSVTLECVRGLSSDITRELFIEMVLGIYEFDFGSGVSVRLVRDEKKKRLYDFLRIPLRDMAAGFVGDCGRLLNDSWTASSAVESSACWPVKVQLSIWNSRLKHKSAVNEFAINEILDSMEEENNNNIRRSELEKLMRIRILIQILENCACVADKVAVLNKVID